jgi:DNA-binding transcriptional LysR family regulator
MSMPPFDLNLLVALDRLLATGSVTTAAKEIGVTQPAMSRALRRLRDATGDPLFVRVGRGVVATERALALREPVAEALAAARRVFDRPRPFDPKTATGEVKIALGDETQVAFSDAILEELWRSAPRLDVRVRRLAYETLDEARRGIVDLAIAPDLSVLPATAGRVDYSDFVARPLYKRRFLVASSPRHPRPRLSLAEYAAADHLVVGPEASGRGFVDDLLEERGLTRRVAATVTSFTNGAHVVARTKLIATLPEEVLRAAAVRLVVTRPPLPIPLLPMLLIWHPRFTTDPRHRFVREVVVRAVGARAPRRA